MLVVVALLVEALLDILFPGVVARAAVALLGVAVLPRGFIFLVGFLPLRILFLL